VTAASYVHLLLPRAPEKRAICAGFNSHIRDSRVPSVNASPAAAPSRQPHQPRSIRPHHSGRRSGPSALISEHDTAAEAFAEIDRLSAQMLRTGAPSDAVELFVVNVAGEIVARPVTH
jgi:hypothetical protein